MGSVKALEEASLALCCTMKTNEDFIALDDRYGAQNYHPIPVVLSRGEGPFLFDVTGKRHFDFLAAYSAANQGHCHPKIVDALVQQASKLTLTSRAFHSDMLSVYNKFMTTFFGYQRVLPMNTGVEAAETAIKLCRKWAYEKKGVPDNQAVILFAEGNFWGRSIAACSSSTDPECFGHFGPYTPGFQIIPYDDLEALKQAFQQNSNVSGFMVEPIQGEAGVRLPKPGYLKAAKDLCAEYNALFIADEIQTGLGRTGKLTCCEHEGVRPDILVLGKALSGGILPASAVLADDEIMLCIRPGQHGSTYGGNPLACRVSMAAITTLTEENMCQNAVKMGEIFRHRLQQLKEDVPFILEVRGKGLMNAVVVKDVDAWTLCVELSKNGVLCKPTHQTIIRFTPPLVIKEEQMKEACDIICKVFRSFAK